LVFSLSAIVQPGTLRAAERLTCESLGACASADAAYLGVGLQLETVVTLSGVARTVYRVYAVFDDPQDYLIGVGGDATNPLEIKSLNAIGTALGGNFYNPAIGGNTAPGADLVMKVPNVQFDTFATIGLAIDDGTDQTMTSEGFPTFISGNQLLSQNMSWFTNGPNEQGRAGGANGVTGFFHDPFDGSYVGMGVLLAQLTVNAGQNVYGKINVSGISDGEVFTETGVEFTSLLTLTPPAPGALALLAMAGLCGRARRRENHSKTR
jgi:MYXO-CTERM domain-containing protein